MTSTQLKYFNDMQPGQTLRTDQVKDPATLIASAKEYIDQFGDLQLNDEHTEVLKLNPIPTTNDITFYLT